MPEQPTTDPTQTAPDATPTTDAPTATATTAADAQTGQPTAPAGPAAPAETPAEAESSSKRKRILSAVGAVALVLAAKFGLGYVLSDKPAADSLSVGQCVERGEDDTIAAVDCGDPKAAFKVVAIKKDTQESAVDQTCAPFEATTMTYFESDKGETVGDTICLGDVR